jgi:uncharacterized protein (DUF4415 family)
MAFKKNNEHRMQSDNPLDESPLTIRLDQGVKAKIRAEPDWQRKIRELLKDWAESQGR